MSPEVKDAREACRKIAQLKWRTMPAITSAEFYNCIQLFTSWASLFFIQHDMVALLQTLFFLSFLNVFPIIKSNVHQNILTTTQLTKYITEVIHLENLRYFWSEVVCGSWTTSFTFFVLLQQMLLFYVALFRLGSLFVSGEDDVYRGETRIYHHPNSSTVEILTWIMAYGNADYNLPLLRQNKYSAFIVSFFFTWSKSKFLAHESVCQYCRMLKSNLVPVRRGNTCRDLTQIQTLSARISPKPAHVFTISKESKKFCSHLIYADEKIQSLQYLIVIWIKWQIKHDIYKNWWNKYMSNS